MPSKFAGPSAAEGSAHASWITIIAQLSFLVAFGPGGQADKRRPTCNRGKIKQQAEAKRIGFAASSCWATLALTFDAQMYYRACCCFLLLFR